MEVKLKGDTPEKKFVHLERILQRMSRRLQKTVIGLVPASPVFGFCADPMTASVMRAIFPADGLITKVAIYFGRRGKEDPELEIKLEQMSSSGYESHAVRVPKKGIVAKVDYPIKAGTRVQASVINPTEEVGDVWVGFLYQVEMQDLAKTKIAIEQFEHLTDGEDYASDKEGS